MSRFVLFLFSLVSLFVSSGLGSPEVPLLRAIRQIYSQHIMLAESSYPLPPQHLLSTPCWIWAFPVGFSFHITTTSPCCPPISRGNLSLLLSSDSSASFGEFSHPQGTNMTYSSVYEIEEARAHEKSFFLFGECRKCQEEHTSNIFETPGVCNASLKYAHQKCVQLWSYGKYNITCGICYQPYRFGCISWSSLIASLNVLLWPSCSTILARFIHRLSTRAAPHPSFKLHLNDTVIVSWLQLQLASPFWKSSLPTPNVSKFGLTDTYSSIQSDIYFSFKERVFCSLSSQWERSTPPPSSDTERTFPPSPYSSDEETFGVQPQTLPLSVDTILTGLKTRFLSNSTELEPIFQSDSITSVIMHLSDTHGDFYEILQIFRDLKKCFISMFNLRLSSCISWILCFSRRILGFLSIFCILKV